MHTNAHQIHSIFNVCVCVLRLIYLLRKIPNWLNSGFFGFFLLFVCLYEAKGDYIVSTFKKQQTILSFTLCYIAAIRCMYLSSGAIVIYILLLFFWNHKQIYFVLKHFFFYWNAWNKQEMQINCFIYAVICSMSVLCFFLLWHFPQLQYF